jgi:ApaG protein
MSSEDSKPGRTKRSASAAAQPPRQNRPAGNARTDYSRTTRDVNVSVRSVFLADQSQPEENHFVWAYRVKIENQGSEPIQLLRRTWQITDARGRTQHVHGAGVVGEQP